MAIVALTNSSSPATVERATADSDPYERETQLNGLALNFDAHDHTSAKGLGVGRVQTAAAPAASGQVRVNGDAWQWWGATAGAVRSAVDVEGAQTISGAKTCTSTLTLTPGVGLAALLLGGDFAADSGIHHGVTTASNLRLHSSGQLELSATGGYVLPAIDGTYYLGAPTLRWTTVFAVAGAINTSSAARKEDITPLDPAACAAAVLETDWVSFSYLPPMYQEPPEQEGQDPDDRQRQVDEGRAAHARMLVETAPARHQKGFVLQSPEHKTHDLYGLEDRESASPSSDHAVTACALQHTILRLQALEAEVAALRTA